MKFSLPSAKIDIGLWLLGLSLLPSAWLALGVGSVDLGSVAGLLWFTGDVPPSWRQTVLWELRLPRVLLALAAGAALALSGAWLQSLLRNPLADPGLLGISAGAALGAVTVGVGLGLPLLAPWGALAGGWGLAWLGYRLTQRRGVVDLAGLLLVGIALNALAGALLGLLLALTGDAQLRQWLFWQWGSLSGAAWPGLVGLTLVLLLGVWASVRAAVTLDVLLLGEADAEYLGVRVAWMQGLGLFLVAALTGVVTALVGVVGFVGLIAPHLARLCVGAGHRRVLPLAALLGAQLLLGADTLARSLLAPTELPLGIVTALLGAPVFLGLWWRLTGDAASPRA
jgi:iron complex transport system permease protein